jgi:hypothetical protein
MLLRQLVLSISLSDQQSFLLTFFFLDLADHQKIVQGGDFLLYLPFFVDTQNRCGIKELLIIL